jgi:threonine aldolase
MHEWIDFRSDTVTTPTPVMRQAMMDAEVGDDVLGDDPTIQRLETLAAATMGKDAGLFVPSGTMGNLIAIQVHTRPGDEILLDWDSHTLCYEVGGVAALAGVQTRPFRSQRGVPDIHEVAAAVQSESLHAPGTTLLVLENTHNRAGGAIIPLEVHTALYALMRERGIPLHLDGARLFNAAVATGRPAADYAAQADTVTFCLSKGLACPVGSVLCGSREFIEKARRIRKRLGGGMRQAGILAACGIVALETMVERLAEDHGRARRLAAGIAGLPGLHVEGDGNPEAVQTNMVYFTTEMPAAAFVERLGAEKLRCLPTAAHRIRLVTHKDVDDQDIEAAIGIFRRITSAL